MYESFFGFSERPFAAAAVAKRYFPAGAIETARQTLGRAIDRAEGVGFAHRAGRNRQVVIVPGACRSIPPFPASDAISQRSTLYAPRAATSDFV